MTTLSLVNDTNGDHMTLIEHVYTSTACQHGLHDQCRRTCKFCDAHCRCNCHTTMHGFFKPWEKA